MLIASFMYNVQLNPLLESQKPISFFSTCGRPYGILLMIINILKWQDVKYTTLPCVY